MQKVYSLPNLLTISRIVVIPVIFMMVYIHATLWQLVAAILNAFWEIYDTLGSREFIKEYRERSMVIGQQVRLQENGEWKEATALDIDDNGGLIVQMEENDGTTSKRVLQTGEITLRLKTGLL